MKTAIIQLTSKYGLLSGQPMAMEEFVSDGNSYYFSDKLKEA